ncbi:phosphatidylglycerol lysyltransferase domain-containing protein [Bacillus tianshenii]|nr:phosphatidylglycerol lysyltransferase domain-containing protein [Bacillus tianshenii]
MFDNLVMENLGLSLAYLTFILVISYVGMYMVKTKKELPVQDEVDYREVATFLKQYDQHSSAHLIFLNDKQLYWAQEKRVLIAYRKIMNKLIVLGDPIGAASSIQAGIKEFKEYAEKHGCVPVFYQISPQYMQYYHDSGYRFFKLGEEGKVELPEFSIAGKKGAKLRTRKNKFERNGFQFKVIKPPYSGKLLAELKVVSDSWLDKRKEKGFSVSYFDKEYVSLFPVATLYNPEGKLIAFATLAGEGKNITIDLMRSLSNSPHGTMDMLFLSIFFWAKENGYQNCSLGVAPLANVGNCKFARTHEKFAHMLFLHGNFLYKFKGLKEYKEKFAHNWEPKYLAYKKSFLTFTVFQIFLLIHHKPKAANKIVQHVTELKRKLG